MGGSGILQRKLPLNPIVGHKSLLAQRLPLNVLGCPGTSDNDELAQKQKED
jgi:hypothetical protein